MFSLKTVVLALAAAAFVQAIPAPGEGPSVSMAQQKCGAEKVVSCCNSKELKNSKSGAEIPIDVLSGECKNIPINILTINQLIPINNFCSDTVSCCSGEQIVSSSCDAPFSFNTQSTDHSFFFHKYRVWSTSSALLS